MKYEFKCNQRPENDSQIKIIISYFCSLTKTIRLSPSFSEEGGKNSRWMKKQIIAHPSPVISCPLHPLLRRSLVHLVDDGPAPA